MENEKSLSSNAKDKDNDKSHVVMKFMDTELYTPVHFEMVRGVVEAEKISCIIFSVLFHISNLDVDSFPEEIRKDAFILHPFVKLDIPIKLNKDLDNLDERAVEAVYDLFKYLEPLTVWN